jgi:hypothetical protein
MSRFSRNTSGVSFRSGIVSAVGLEFTTAAYLLSGVKYKTSYVVPLMR